MASVNTFKAICIDGSKNRIYYSRNCAIYYKDLTTQNQTTLCGAPGQSGWTESTSSSTNVRFSALVTSICLDTMGALIIVDSGNHCIRKINLNAAGHFVSSELIAGVPGSQGYNGESKLARVTLLNSPTFARVDSYNTIYFSDTGNYLIRRISATGRIETVAGRFVNGQPTNQAGGDSLSDGTEANAKNYTLVTPRGIAFDSANTLYIADAGANRVLKIPSDGIIKGVCGGFTNQFPINIENINSTEPFDAFSYFINNPYGLAFDANMNLYVTSFNNNQILKLSDLSYPNPKISIFCGIANSRIGKYRINEQAARYAELNGPSDIDYRVSTDIVYFIDEKNNRIRSIKPEEKDVYSAGDTGALPYGLITPIANVNQISKTKGGNLALSQTINVNFIQRDDLGNIYYLYQDQLSFIEVESGRSTILLSNLTNRSYFCIYDTYYVYFIAGNTTTKTLQVYNSKDKVPPLDMAGISGNFQTLCVHPGGTLFIGQAGKISAVNLKDLSPTLSDFYTAGGSYTSMCIDNENNLYAVQNNTTILKFSVQYNAEGGPSFNSSSLVSRVFTGGNITSLAFNPKDPSNIYFSNTASSSTGVYSINKQLTGSPLLVAGKGTPGLYTSEVPPNMSYLKNPVSILFNYKGELFIADNVDTMNTTILKVRYRQFLVANCIYNVIGFGKSNTAQSTSDLTGVKANYSDTNAVSVTFDSDKNIFLAERDKIRKIDMNTGIVTRLVFTSTPAISLTNITDVKVGRGGELYIVDATAKRVYRAAKTDTVNSYTISLFAGNGTDTITTGFARNSGMQPNTIALDSAGNVYIFCSAQHRILKVDYTGMLSIFAGTGNPVSSGDGQAAVGANLNYPMGGIFTPNGELVFSDTNDNRVRKIRTDNTIITLAGGGPTNAGFTGDGSAATWTSFLNTPRFVTADSAGNIYFADQKNNRIRRIDAANNIITTVAGNGAPEFTGGIDTAGLGGDGDQAILASISNPYALSIDSSNRLIVLQSSPIRLRIIPLQSTTVAQCNIPIK